MFVLVEFNNFYKDSIKELKKENLTPITVFNLIIKDKISTKNNLDKIKEIKNKIQPEYSAIKVTIDKLDNNTQGFVNGLKREFNLVIGFGGLNKINRFFLEETQIDFLADPQNSIFKSKIDFIHHFNTGLNQVLCRAAKDREINFFISLNFTSQKSYNVAKEIGRLNEVLKFARKYEIKSHINFIIQGSNQIKSIKEIDGVMSLFNVSTEQKKEGIDLLEQTIIKNNLKKSDKYIREGLEII